MVVDLASIAHIICYFVIVVVVANPSITGKDSPTKAPKSERFDITSGNRGIASVHSTPSIIMVKSETRENQQVRANDVWISGNSTLELSNEDRMKRFEDMKMKKIMQLEVSGSCSVTRM